MKRFYFARLSLLVAILLRSGLGASAQIVSTFAYTGSVQTYQIPLGVFSLTVDAQGANGGVSTAGAGAGGCGARVQCNLATTPGQIIYLYVGGVGQNSANCCSSIPAPGGFNGGGASSFYYAAGGGGATDIRVGSNGLINRVVVAGGGGGGGYGCGGSTSTGQGGPGGGLTGGTGYYCNSNGNQCYNGQGGTQTGGGAAGTCGCSSAAGVLAVGGTGGTCYYGGGGGGGYYGGGGAYGGGGGGGSSYTDAVMATGVTHTQGFNCSGGSGVLTFTANCTPPTAGTVVSPGPICGLGGSYLFSDPAGSKGGVWSSLSPGVGTIDPNTGIFTALGYGTTQISYTLTYVCGATTATYTATVSPVPSPIGGNSPICQGKTQSLTETAAGTWTSSNPGLATVAPGPAISVTMSALLPGNPTITYTAPTGCQVTSVSTINPIPAPIVSSTGVMGLCVGTTLQLSDATSGATWNSSAPGVATVSNGGGLVTAVTTSSSVSTTIISYTFPSTSCQVTSTVSVNPLPTGYSLLGFGTDYCAGGAGIDVQTNSSDIGTSYQLYQGPSKFGSPFLGTGSGIDWGFIKAAGTYTAQATTGFGCVKTLPGTAPIAIDANPTIYHLILGGSGTICAGSGTSFDIYVDSSQTNVNYVLYNSILGIDGIVPAGSVIPPAIADFGVYTDPGVYTATGSITYPSGVTCTSNMIGSPSITVSAPPNVYNMTPLSGAGSLCPGGSGVRLGLDNSEPGITYELYYMGTGTGIKLPGSSSSLDFGYFTNAGNYYIVATNNVSSCQSTMNGSVTITINPVPNVDTISAGGTYCFGGSGVDLTLNTSDASTNYQVFFNSNPWGAPIAGTGGPGTLDLGSDTGVGNYTVVATNSYGCVANMFGTAVIGTYPQINVYSINSGGAFCLNGAGFDLNLSGSDGSSISYQLMSGSTAIGAPLTGTGGSIDFGLNPVGTYSVVATNPTTGCSVNMAGTAVITTNPLPNIDSMTGGGNYCIGGTGVHVGLDFSNLGVKYDLYDNGVYTGSTMAGSSAALDFGLETITGSYTVIATNTTTSCSDTMYGTSVVTSSVPPSVYAVTASGSSYCAGGTGIDVMLASSDTGVSYQLMYNGTPLGLAQAGTGLNLDYGLQTVPGSYSVVASNGGSGCSSNMFGTATITINPLPIVYSVTGGGNYCAGGTGVHVGLNNSDNMISYQLWNMGSPVGSPVTGLGGSIDFGAQTSGGSYKVIATNTTTTCMSMMSDSAMINILPVPNVYNVTGGGTLCAGDPGYMLSLSGSDNGVTYQLYNGPVSVGPAVPGTNLGIDFGIYSNAGTYTAIATNISSGCTSNMAGSGLINVNPAPPQFTVYGGGTFCAGGAGEHVYLSGSAFGSNYQLYDGPTAIGGFMTATGGYLDFGAQKGAGSYTVVATDALTGCSSLMLSSTSINVNPTPTVYSLTGGGHYCAGGSGVHIGLSWSDAGIGYQLLKGSVPVGMSRPGGGIVLDYGLITDTGLYTITATDMVTGCSAAMSGSTDVAIDPYVTPTVSISTGSGSTVCAGAAVNFVAMPVYGGPSPTYVWSVNGVNVALRDTFNYVPSDHDVVAVQLTSDQLCATYPIAKNSMVMSVTPFKTPAVSITADPAPAVCKGTPVTFTATPSNGGTAPKYNWILNSKIVDTTNTSFMYTPNDGDVIIFLLGSNYPCRLQDTVLSNTFKMEVDPSIPPVVSIFAHPGTLVAQGQADTLDASATHAGLHPSFQWSLNGAPIPGATNSRYVNNYFYSTNSLTCQVTSSDACGLSSFNTVTITVKNVGVQQVTSAGTDIIVVPNPNKGAFTIKGSLGNAGDEEVSLELTNMLGQVIYNNKVMSNNGNIDEHIQLSGNVASGMYILTVRSGDVNNVYHVVIEQ